MTFRHYKWDITASNLPAPLVVLYKKAEAILMVGLLPFWEYKPETAAHQIAPSQPKIRFETMFHPKTDTFDVILSHERDICRFSGINYGVWGWKMAPQQRLEHMFPLPLPFLHTSYLTPETAAFLYHNDMMTRCTASRNSLRTYHNTTLSFAVDHDCWTLLSADCGHRPTFAVFMRKEKKAAMGLMMFIGDTKLEFIPIGKDRFRLEVGGHALEMRDNAVLYWSQERGAILNVPIPHFIFKIVRRNNNFRIDFFPHIIINFDGNSVTTMLGPVVRGTHCGMCGDYSRNKQAGLMDPQVRSASHGYHCSVL